MTNLEICDALFADKLKLDIKREQLRLRIVNLFKKEDRFPAWHYEEYIHQESRNRFLITFYAATRQSVENPDTGFVAFLDVGGERVVIKWGTWMYRRSGSNEQIATRTIAYYRRHFFDRYRERIWANADIPYYDLLCRYFSRNRVTIPIEMNEDIKRGYQDYGEYALFSFKVSDGICYIRSWNEGEIETVNNRDSNFISVGEYITFVDYETMTDKQNHAIDKAAQEYMNSYYRSLFQDIKSNS